MTVLAVANRKKTSLPGGLYLGMMLLTLLNVGLAVFWSRPHLSRPGHAPGVRDAAAPATLSAPGRRLVAT